MSQLVHWENTRDAIRAKLGSHFSGDLEGTPSEAELDGLAAALANTAIEAYTKSIFENYMPTPREFAS